MAFNSWTIKETFNLNWNYYCFPLDKFLINLVIFNALYFLQYNSATFPGSNLKIFNCYRNNYYTLFYFVLFWRKKFSFCKKFWTFWCPKLALKYDFIQNKKSLKFEMKLFLVIMLSKSKFNRLTHLCCEGEKEKNWHLFFFGSKKVKKLKVVFKNIFPVFTLLSIDKESNNEVLFSMTNNKFLLFCSNWL